MTHTSTASLWTLIVLLSEAGAANAAIVQYSNFSAWQSAAQSHTTITFTEIPKFSLLGDQYADLGVTFPDGSDFTFDNPRLFPLDGTGVHGGSNGRITIDFDAPRTAIAAHYTGALRYLLFSRGDMIGAAEFLGPGTIGVFAGLTSDIPFDSVVIRDPVDPVVLVDTLYFGPPIPAPGAGVILILGLATARRARRCRSA